LARRRGPGRLLSLSTSFLRGRDPVDSADRPCVGAWLRRV